MGMLWGHFGMCASVLRAARSWPAHAVPRPEITGLAVPVAFTLHVPVQRDGECEYEHYGGVLQEEATKETSMLALEMLLKEVFFRDASENLARALGIAGGVFDTARWPDAVIAQADV
jgi:hypothetical protein